VRRAIGEGELLDDLLLRMIGVERPELPEAAPCIVCGFETNPGDRFCSDGCEREYDDGAGVDAAFDGVGDDA
jgi:hypothetical protein